MTNLKGDLAPEQSNDPWVDWGGSPEAHKVRIQLTETEAKFLIHELAEAFNSSPRAVGASSSRLDIIASIQNHAEDAIRRSKPLRIRITRG